MTVTPRQGPEKERPEGADHTEAGSGQNPPFLIFRKRLYVLAKKAPGLRRPSTEAGERAVRVERARDAPRSRPVAIVGRGRTRPQRRRVRPYVKGTFRVYSQRFPHLAPVSDRRRARRVSVRTLD